MDAEPAEPGHAPIEPQPSQLLIDLKAMISFQRLPLRTQSAVLPPLTRPKTQNCQPKQGHARLAFTRISLTPVFFVAHEHQNLESAGRLHSFKEAFGEQV
jgi:hypothetical protein